MFITDKASKLHHYTFRVARYIKVNYYNEANISKCNVFPGNYLAHFVSNIIL